MHPKDTVYAEFRCSTDQKGPDAHHNHQAKSGPARVMARRLQFASLEDFAGALEQHERGETVVLPVTCNPCGAIAGQTMELLSVQVVPYAERDTTV